MSKRTVHRIGLISDTHKLLRPEAVDYLRGSDLIVHAGDLVTPDALETLRALAPVVAVRGNNDRGEWAAALQQTERVTIAGACILVIHDLADLRTSCIDPVREGVRVVVCGHSHKPKVEDRDGVLYVNPGSAGPRRFSLPVTAAELLVGSNGEVQARVAALL